jgi:hypothetical protein
VYFDLKWNELQIWGCTFEHETTEQLKKFVTEHRTRKLPETPAKQHATTPGNVTEPDLEKPVRILQGFRFEELTYDTII